PQADDAAEHAAEIGRQERHPREQRDLFEVEVSYRVQGERPPERQRAPGAVGEEPGKRDAPEVALREDAANRRPRPVAAQVLLLAGDDVVTLCRRQPLVTGGRNVGGEPQSTTSVTH